MALHRRDVLKTGLGLSAVSLLAPYARAAETSSAFDPQPGAWRSFEITTEINILKPQGLTQAWIPLPSISESAWMRPEGDSWQIASGHAAVAESGGAKLLHVRWPDGDAAPAIKIVSRVSTRDRAVDLSKPGTPKSLAPEERTAYLSPTALIPTDGIVKQTSDRIVAGAIGEEDKARRIYEWVVENTFRDPKTQGCGTGDVASMLEAGNLGGKCADLNALYVGLARAAGLPARDLYGIRVAPSRFGYKCLGANSATITKSQHCRAEVYLSRFGWVPADPADVRKVVLEEPPGNLPLDALKVIAARKTLFGAWEGNWIAYNCGHDIVLPGSHEKPIGFLMYPQAETAAGMHNELSPDTFQYTITTREVV